MATTTTRLALQQPVTTDGVPELRVAIGANAGTLDNAVLFTSGTLASRPVSTSGTPGIDGRRYLATDQTPAPGVEYLDYGTGWVATNAERASHSFTTSSLVSPDVAGTIMGSFFVDPVGGTIALVEVVIHCVTVGGTPSVFKVQTDHAAHGTLADVTGLTSLTPATTQAATTPGSPVLLSSLDRVSVVVVTAGNSLGCTIDVKTSRSA